MHLVSSMEYSLNLRYIPLKLLTKTVKSNRFVSIFFDYKIVKQKFRFFTLNEYQTFLTIITWIFLNINRDIKEVPTESVMITYFSR